MQWVKKVYVERLGFSDLRRGELLFSEQGGRADSPGNGCDPKFFFGDPAGALRRVFLGTLIGSIVGLRVVAE